MIARPMAVLALTAALLFAASQEAPAQAPSPSPSPGVNRAPSPNLSPAETRRRQAASQRRAQEAATGEPDVLLDIPNLSVDKIQLEVRNLEAHVALDARLANLLKLTAGADVSIDQVSLTIEGVQAEVLLKVRLDNVRDIIDRTLTTVDRNPQILTQLLKSVDNAVDTVGDVADTALQPGGVLSEVVNAAGQTVRTVLDQGGNIVQQTLGTAGQVIGSTNLGKVTDLPVLSQTTNAAGHLVKRVRDSRTGKTIEYVVDSAGKVLSSRVL